jgi:acyl-CoA synthetase (AMP-forming)/AMP-acid ligase II
LAFCSGGNISTTLAKRFSNLEIDELKLMSVHGISTCPVTACVGMVVFKKYAALSAHSTMPAGIAAPNHSLYISDTLGRFFPSFWKGEVLGGPGACAGIFGPTANDHGCRVYEDIGERIVRTGDTGYLEDGGQLTIVSRLEDVSVVRLPEGFVDLNDVARTADAAVTQHRDDKQQLQAFIVSFPEPDMNILTDLQGLLQQLQLPAYLLPTSVILFDALPLKRGGGVDRKQLQS